MRPAEPWRVLARVLDAEAEVTGEGRESEGE